MNQNLVVGVRGEKTTLIKIVVVILEVLVSKTLMMNLGGNNHPITTVHKRVKLVGSLLVDPKLRRLNLIVLLPRNCLTAAILVQFW